jgi:curved DNA-binding protein CbpA
MINYYEVLGVNIKAEAIVIRSAYKAMVQKYHPDKAVGQKQIDEYLEKTKLINEAYDVLSDEVKRNKYDEELSNNKSEKNQNNEGFKKDNDSSSKKQSNQSSDDWETVIKYFPDVNTYYNELEEISEVLAAEFKLYILNEKEFKKAKGFYEKLKKRFFGDIFGDNKECNDFALWLLKNKKKELFLEFREIFCLMSKSIDSKELIYKFCEERNLMYDANDEINKPYKQKIKKGIKRIVFFIKYIISIPAILLSFGFVHDGVNYNQYLLVFIVILFWLFFIFISKLINKLLE